MSFPCKPAYRQAGGNPNSFKIDSHFRGNDNRVKYSFESSSYFIDKNTFRSIIRFDIEVKLLLSDHHSIHDLLQAFALA